MYMLTYMYMFTYMFTYMVKISNAPPKRDLGASRWCLALLGCMLLVTGAPGSISYGAITVYGSQMAARGVAPQHPMIEERIHGNNRGR